VEGQGFRAEFQNFEKNNCMILGMSADPPKAQKKFSDKYSFQFPLLSDESKTTLKAYEAWGLKKFMGREYEGIHRISYLIDEQGIILKAYPKIKVKEHAGQVLLDLAEIG